VVRRPPPVLPSKPKKNTNDLICAKCGEINTSNRRFCSRCGNPIEGGQVNAPAAKSSRVGGLGLRGVLVRRVAPAVVVGLTLLYAAVPSARNWVNDLPGRAMDAIDPPGHVAVPSPPSQASTEIDDHTGAAALDLNPLTYWATQPQDTRPTLTMTFGVPVRVNEAIIRNGALDANNDYRYFRRARQVVVILQFVDGSQKQVPITLADSSITLLQGTRVIAGQRVSLHNSKPVARMQLAIVSAYDAPAGASLAITEVELLAEKG
jgi:hypothetical protein